MFIKINPTNNEIIATNVLVDKRFSKPECLSPGVYEIKFLPTTFNLNTKGVAWTIDRTKTPIHIVKVKDFRGEKYSYLSESLMDESGEPAVIEVEVKELFFDLPDGATFKPKPDENHKLKNGVWTIDETLARNSAINKIKRKVSEITDLVTGGADAKTISRWVRKSIVAEKIVNKTADESDKVSISMEVQARNKGESVEKLAKIQYQKSQQFSIVSAFIDGLESNAISIIKKTEVAKLDETLKKLSSKADKQLNALMGKK